MISSKTKKTLLSMAIILSMGATFFSPIKAHAAGFQGAHHATVGADVFLGGNYIEVGVNKYGSFGTEADAPAGFHPITSQRNNLGLCADGDGFDVGNAPTTGDFFLPGDPFEGYVVAYKDSSGTATEYGVAAREDAPNDPEDYNWFGITNISTTDTSSGDKLSATTVGTTADGKLEITQVVSFNVNDKYFNIHVTYKNISSETLYDARYLRVVDPDQDADLNDEYSTRNSVPKNPPGDGMAIVIAKGDFTGDAFFYAASDSRARAVISGWDTFDPYSEICYKEDGSAFLSAESIDDTCISTTFDLGNIAPGASVSLDLINSLDPNADEALAAISSKTVEGVNSLNDIPVSIGTDKNSIGLPNRIGVTLNDGTTTSAAVTWDNENTAYDGNTLGTYAFTGTLTLPDGITNPNNYTASVNVIVQAENDEPANNETTPAAVRIEGTTKVGDTLTAQLKDEGGNNFTTSAGVIYEWYKLDSADSEFVNQIGTGKTYKLTASDLSKYIGVLVRYGEDTFEYVIGRITAATSSSTHHHHSSTTETSNNTDTKKKDNKTGWTQETNDAKYYLKEDGSKTTGWKLIDNTWYFFNNKTGAMIKGWYKSEAGDWNFDKNDTVGQWFHLDQDGKLTLGWLKDADGNWYYLCNGNAYGALGVMLTGWQRIDGNWYYFNNSGVMASNAVVDGYTLGSNGAWIQ